MKKHYINPKTLIIEVKSENLLTMASVGNAYNPDDVTYGRHNRGQWDDEDEW